MCLGRSWPSTASAPTEPPRMPLKPAWPRVLLLAAPSASPAQGGVRAQAVRGREVAPLQGAIGKHHVCVEGLAVQP